MRIYEAPNKCQADYIQFLPLVAARIGQSHGILQFLAESKTPIRAEVLAQRCGIHPTILDSILEYMASQDMISELALSQYAATKLTHLLLTPVCLDGFVVL
jgi:hypothetical protein